MDRGELLTSKEYWITRLQVELFQIVKQYLDRGHSQTELAEKLGVSKGYISQILNGNFDHRISKFVELSLAVNKIPKIIYYDIEEFIKLDKKVNIHDTDTWKIYPQSEEEGAIRIEAETEETVSSFSSPTPSEWRFGWGQESKEQEDSIFITVDNYTYGIG